MNNNQNNEYHQMLSKISHEIRNPVALISSFLQLLSGNHPELLEDGYYQRILDNMEVLKALLDELTSYNHSHTVTPKDLNPYILLQEIAADAGAMLETANISIILDKQSAIPRIPLDSIKFRQLCYNLIRNAEEAMPNGGTIKLTLSCDGAFVRLQCQDNGTGIPAEYLSSIFEPFVTHKKGGTGLGLAICREIALAHGGSISAESEMEKGTIFTVLLPVG